MEPEVEPCRAAGLSRRVQLAGEARGARHGGNKRPALWRPNTRRMTGERMAGEADAWRAGGEPGSWLAIRLG